MFSGSKDLFRDATAKLAALDKSLATIEFEMDGTIITANSNFCNAMGYSLNEIQGKHHSMFAEPAYSKSQEYKDFWVKLNRGEFSAGQYKRIGKGGKEIWIEASYNPLLDSKGKPYKVVKYTTDITKQKLTNADFEGQIDAIGKSQAVIHFHMDGTIIKANSNFCNVMGYSLDEIQGKHHSMFAEPAFARSQEYKDFWAKLNRGEFSTGQYKRLGKGGKEIWIEASYNPIMDMNGKSFKVVKYATDITKQKLSNADFEGQIDAIGKSQAVIHFNMDGTIITANSNFCNAMGYSLDEIQGKHHSMFAEPAFAASHKYKDFWAKLNRGEFQSAEYMRLGKGGREVWIMASYNPIMDMNGKPFKVVKYAVDITPQMQARIRADQLVTETNLNVNSVAAASEEMTASISEISKNMQLSKQAVHDIVTKTDAANVASTQLQNSSKSMEGVVDLIRNIAGQVNLLALNATIEAARAGDAGKGFAVVAAEVKNLATQTTKATDEIAKEIQAMQVVSQDVAASVNAITGTTSSVSEYVTGVASAIEEQSAVTREISSNMQKISSAVADINDCVKKIAGTRA
ncbi:MAG: methyl-accepting chemotaxis protein [Alphaproteobacteria bacterium]|nr:methyl-accepting chemotaxis protein [Alphaproteobacteria bacterium]